MFWTVSGSNPHIGKASMDGENKQLYPVTGAPTSLSIRSDGILWADTEGNRIVLISFDGSSSTQFLVGLNLPLSAISELNNIMYFVGQFGGVQSIQLNSTELEDAISYLSSIGCLSGNNDIKVVENQQQGDKM